MLPQINKYLFKPILKSMMLYVIYFGLCKSMLIKSYKLHSVLLMNVFVVLVSPTSATLDVKDIL